MSVPLLLLVTAFVALLLGFLLGRWFGGRGEASQARQLLEGERRRAEDSQSLALARAEGAALGRERDRLQGELGTAHGELTAGIQALSGAHSRLAAAEAEGRARADNLREKELRLSSTEMEVARLGGELRKVSAELEGARKQIEVEAAEGEKKLKLLRDAEETLGNQFKVLAADIFREKAQHFKQESEKGLGDMLNPLRERMGEFQQRVEALRDDGIKGREELRQHIGDLKNLNQQLSSEASNLVRALKGSSKTQGDWGEFVLEQMLESAGLRRDHEYRVQTSYAGAENGRSRPDVILNLPGERHLVIDAKVSLLDYSAYCDCDDEPNRAVSLGRHVGSVRSHIKELSARNYQGLYELRSMDFVVMFVPIEPAFLLAIARDGALWQEAWDKNVLLVSPSTLLFVVRTVAHLWRQEQQRNNVQEIVKRGGELYDKLAAFAKDLMDVGTKLGDAQKSYDGAYSKLARGKGNAIRQVEMLRALGVKPSKQMPKELLDTAQEDLLHSLSATGDEELVTPNENGGS